MNETRNEMKGGESMSESTARSKNESRALVRARCLLRQQEDHGVGEDLGCER